MACNLNRFIASFGFIVASNFFRSMVQLDNRPSSAYYRGNKAIQKLQQKEIKKDFIDF